MEHENLITVILRALVFKTAQTDCSQKVIIVIEDPSFNYCYQRSILIKNAFFNSLGLK